jgi:hypothetical protein
MYRGKQIIEGTRAQTVPADASKRGASKKNAKAAATKAAAKAK